MTTKTRSVSREDRPGPDILTAPSEDLEQATGTADPELQAHLVVQLSAALLLPDELNEDEKKTRFQAALTCLKGLAPSDVAEGMLASQMVATHEAALECLKRAASGKQSREIRDQDLKIAAKLLTTYAHLLYARDRHRLKEREIGRKPASGGEPLIIRRIIVDSQGNHFVPPAADGADTEVQ